MSKSNYFSLFSRNFFFFLPLDIAFFSGVFCLFPIRAIFLGVWAQWLVFQSLLKVQTLIVQPFQVLS